MSRRDYLKHLGFQTAEAISKITSMEQNNITADDMNEVIAQFDGWEKKSPREFVKDGYMRYVWEFKYHSSWDELMPVVGRIPKLIHAESDINTRRQMYARWKPIENELCNINITNVHYCVFKFLQWYNQLKQNNE